MFEVDALVDTGASHSMFPASLLDALHIPRRSQFHGILADGTEVSHWNGRVLIGIEEGEEICLALFGPEGDDSSVIGAHDAATADVQGGPGSRETGTDYTGAHLIR